MVALRTAICSFGVVRIQFRWAVKHWVVPLGNCWANKRVLQRLRGAAQHAKGCKATGVTSSEMLSSQHWSLGLRNVIFALFSLFFLKKWAVVPSVGPGTIVSSPSDLLGKQMRSGKAESHRTTCNRFQDQ